MNDNDKISLNASHPLGTHHSHFLSIMNAIYVEFRTRAWSVEFFCIGKSILFFVECFIIVNQWKVKIHLFLRAVVFYLFENLSFGWILKFWMSNKVQCRTRLQMLYWFFFYTECNIYRSKYNTAFRMYKNVRIMEFLNNRVVNFPVRNFIYSITDHGNCQPVSTLKNSILFWLLNYIDFFIRAIL